MSIRKKFEQTDKLYHFTSFETAKKSWSQIVCVLAE